MEIKTLDSMFDAIKTMIVRGAPAIGHSRSPRLRAFALELLSKIVPIEDLWQDITPLNINENQRKEFLRNWKRALTTLIPHVQPQ